MRLVFWRVFSTQKNPPVFFGYVPGCLNPGHLAEVVKSNMSFLWWCVVSATTRPNWREERKLNVETFGARSASQYSRRGGYRGGRMRGGRGLRGPPNRGTWHCNFITFFFPVFIKYSNNAVLLCSANIQNLAWNRTVNYCSIWPETNPVIPNFQILI